MASRYGTFGQVTGREIIQGGNVIDLIDLQDRQYVSAIGIHTDPNREIEINGQYFLIGERGTLQFDDVNIKMVKFPINEEWPINDTTVVTFAIDEEVF